jgi:hypothetical protein
MQAVYRSFLRIQTCMYYQPNFGGLTLHRREWRHYVALGLKKHLHTHCSCGIWDLLLLFLRKNVTKTTPATQTQNVSCNLRNVYSSQQRMSCGGPAIDSGAKKMFKQLFITWSPFFHLDANAWADNHLHFGSSQSLGSWYWWDVQTELPLSIRLLQVASTVPPPPSKIFILRDRPSHKHACGTTRVARWFI